MKRGGGNFTERTRDTNIQKRDAKGGFDDGGGKLKLRKKSSKRGMKNA